MNIVELRNFRLLFCFT